METPREASHQPPPWRRPVTRSMRKDREEGDTRPESPTGTAPKEGEHPLAAAPESKGRFNSNVFGSRSGVAPEHSEEVKSNVFGACSGVDAPESSGVGTPGRSHDHSHLHLERAAPKATALTMGSETPGDLPRRPPPGMVPPYHAPGSLWGAPGDRDVLVGRRAIQPAGEWWKTIPVGRKMPATLSYASIDQENAPPAAALRSFGMKKEEGQPPLGGKERGDAGGSPRDHATSPRSPLGTSVPCTPQSQFQKVIGTGGVAKPVVLPGKYDGATDLGEYLSHFDLCIRANSWEPAQAGMFLGLSLTGVARRLLTGQEPATERGYWELRAALERRFQPRNQSEMYKALLRNRERKASEPLQSFAEDVLRLTRLAYPVADAGTTDSMSRDRFVEGLGDQRLRHWIFQSKPASMEEAVAYSLEAEAFLQSDKEKAGSVVRATSSTMAEQLKALTDEFASWKSQPNTRSSGGVAPRQRSGGRREGRCFRCGQEGHFRDACTAIASEKEKQFLAARSAMFKEQDQKPGN